MNAINSHSMVRYRGDGGVVLLFDILLRIVAKKWCTYLRGMRGIRGGFELNFDVSMQSAVEGPLPLELQQEG